MDTYDQKRPCEDDCPVKKTAHIIEGKWTTLVIRELLPGKKRFSVIQRALTGISPKVLTTRLRMLEQRGLVTRAVFATIPPTTEYELTPIGRQLEPVLNAMAKFGTELDKVQATSPSQTRILGATEPKGAMRHAW
jgi:DNA-binding HxlR family transcriptional regulator